MGRALSIAVCVVCGSCMPGEEGWRQTHFGDGLGPAVGEARCWVVRFEDASGSGAHWVDTVHAPGGGPVPEALPWLLRAGDRGAYAGPADATWTAFSRRPGEASVDVRFEVVHVCAPDRPEVDGALAALAQPGRPWKRWGLACWCAPAGGDDRPWCADETVHLTTVARRWPDPETAAHRAVQTWNWGEEDQVLPVVHGLLTAHPSGGLLVGPAWELFGPGGLASAGWPPEATVVLELTVVRPDLRADHEDAGALCERRDGPGTPFVHGVGGQQRLRQGQIGGHAEAQVAGKPL